MMVILTKRIFAQKKKKKTTTTTESCFFLEKSTFESREDKLRVFPTSSLNPKFGE